MQRMRMGVTESDGPATEPGTGLDWIDKEQGERIPNQTESGTETKHRVSATFLIAAEVMATNSVQNTP